jgi:PAS domain S-box-containing protein
MEDLFAARDAYLAGEPAPAGVRPVVLSSWERCRAYGIDPERLAPQAPDPVRLAVARRASQALLRAADPFLALVDEVLGTQPHVVALSDPDGLILDLRASSHPAGLADVNIFAGASWHERDIGCNGIGTCLAAAEPVILIGPEHFQASYVDWTCIGVPLRDAHGAIVGALDFSVPREASCTPHWGWILSVAKGIEISLARGGVPDRTEAELSVGAPLDPVAALQGVFDLLASGFDVAPTHAGYLAEARSRLSDVQAVLEDTLERLAASERRAKSDLAQLRSIYDTAPVGLAVLDSELRYLRINDRLAEINGMPATAHIGRTVREVLPELADTLEPVLRDVLERGEPVIGHELVGETPGRPGETQHWIARCLPLQDSSGHTFGVNVVVEDVTEQKRAQEQVRDAYEAARRAVEERDRVMAIVSHDLRNPLNAVVMASDLLLLDLPEKKRQGYVAAIKRSANFMKQLVDDLLDAANIEAGGLRLVRKTLSVDQLLTAAVDAIAPLAAARSLQLIVDVPQGLEVRADRKRTMQVLDNLMGNAITHSPDGGTVRISAAHAGGPDAPGDGVRFTVTDMGPGIPATDLHRVFDRFWQGQNRRGEGSGLGLAIARGIVEAHGGRIWVESDEGRGSTFGFTLPPPGTPARRR